MNKAKIFLLFFIFCLPIYIIKDNVLIIKDEIPNSQIIIIKQK